MLKNLKQLLYEHRDENESFLINAIKEWFGKHHENIEPIKIFSECHEINKHLLDKKTTYPHLFNSNAADHKISFLLKLLGEVLPDDLIKTSDSGWPVPIQNKLNILLKGGSNTIHDYRLLYESIIHLHFVVIASEFLNLIEPSIENDKEILIGYKIIHQTLNTPNCMGGRVWLQRASCLTKILQKYESKLVLPNIVKLLQPEKLSFNENIFHNYENIFNPSFNEFISSNGEIYNLFHTLQEIRNYSAHSDRLRLNDQIAIGIEKLLFLLCEEFSCYKKFSILLATCRNKNLVIKGTWNESGDYLNSENKNQFKISLKSKKINANEDDVYLAPYNDKQNEWGLESFEDSMVIINNDDPLKSYLYLAPWGVKNPEISKENNAVPGLLDSVPWISNRARRYPHIIQKSYYDESELNDNYAEIKSTDVSLSFAAKTLVENIVDGLIKKFPNIFSSKKHSDQTSNKNFDLKHSAVAHNVANNKFLREKAVDELLKLAHHNTNQNNCNLVALVGQSGAGKSVLMSQAFLKEENISIFYSMDSVPLAESEIADLLENKDSEREGSIISKEFTNAFASIKEPELIPTRVTSEQKTHTAPHGYILSMLQDNKTIAVPIRMHWLDNLSRLTNKNRPVVYLPQNIVRTQIRNILEENITKKIFIFIDAVNQHNNIEDLFSGFLPLNELPKNITFILSTQDNQAVFEQLKYITPYGLDWKKLDIGELSLAETEIMLKLNWPENIPLPKVKPSLLNEIHEKSAGLPIIVNYWAGRLLELCSNSNPSSALIKINRELSEAGSGNIPREYLDRLKKEIGREFNPSRLPECLLWCICLIKRPLTIEDLFNTIQKIHDVFELPEISRHEISIALSRISGFLEKDYSQDKTTAWRIAHPSLAESWIKEFGKPELLNRLNEGLISFGVTPQVKDWSEQLCEKWLLMAIEDAWDYHILEYNLKEALVKGLIHRVLNSNLGLKWSSRIELLNAIYSTVLWNLDQLEVDESITNQSYNAISAKKISSTKADPELIFDFCRIAKMKCYWFWKKKESEKFNELYKQVVSELETLKLLFPKYWNDKKEAILLAAYADSFYVLNQDEALEKYNQVTKINFNPHISSKEAKYSLALLYYSRCYIFWKKSEIEKAKADIDKSCELLSSLNLSLSKDILELVDRLFTSHTLSLEMKVKDYEEAISKCQKAVVLLEKLDQNSFKVKEKLAQAYVNIAAILDDHQKNHEEAINYYEIASTTFSDLEDDFNKGELVACLYNYGYCLLRCEKEHEAFQKFNLAIKIINKLDDSSEKKKTYREPIQNKLLELARKRSDHQFLSGFLAAHFEERTLLVSKEIGCIFNSEINTEAIATNSYCDSLINFTFTSEIKEEIKSWIFSECKFYSPSFDYLKEILQIKKAELSFYPGYHLIVITDPRRASRREVFAISKLGKTLTMLNWTNDPIYQTNKLCPIDLSTIGNIQDYFRFFFTFVIGRHGRFIPIDDANDLPWLDSNHQSKTTLTSVITPLVISENDDEKAKFQSNLLFRDSYFTANVEIYKNDGLVQLSDENLVLEDLPIKADIMPWVILKD